MGGGGRGRWDTTELKRAPLVLVMSTTLATGDSKGRGVMGFGTYCNNVIDIVVCSALEVAPLVSVPRWTIEYLCL